MSAPDWISERKATVAALALVVLGAVALGALTWRARHLHAPAPVAEAAASGVLPAPAWTPPASEPGSATARMRQEFDAAPDYLAFIESAMSRPQEGGKFYALLAWRRCDERRDDKPLTVAPPAGQAASTAIDLDQRCAGVKTHYPDLQTLYRVATELRGGRDLLLPDDGRGFIAPATRETAQADIDAAVKSGDRYAIAQAMKANARYLDTGEAPPSSDATPQPATDVKLPPCAEAGNCTDDDLRELVRSRAADSVQVLRPNAAASGTAPVVIPLDPGAPGEDRD